MTDKEVGQLWRELQSLYPKSPDTLRTISLIRKLVNERAQNHSWSQGRGRTVLDFDRMALRDFGIDPKEWQE